MRGEVDSESLRCVDELDHCVPHILLLLFCPNVCTRALSYAVILIGRSDLRKSISVSMFLRTSRADGGGIFVPDPVVLTSMALPKKKVGFIENVSCQK